MKILELCPYSAGGCGVWARVKRESTFLSERGHEVRVFTTNLEKGTNKVVPGEDSVGKVKIKRFPATKLGGESYMEWNFGRAAIEFQPDIIITHTYRHTHSSRALEVAKKLKCKVFLVTHAPFNRDSTRTFIQKNIVGLYDKYIGPKKIKEYDKVLAISKWEYPYLQNLGVKKEDIIYSPNGILNEFFIEPLKKGDENIVTFAGRIAPIKNLEVVIKALALTKNKKLKFEALGPAETEYKKKLISLIKENGVENRVKILDNSYNSQQQISHLNKGAINILPSHSEGMPQSLIEAMSRKRIMIASDILALRDLIEDKKNGFLFKTDNAQDLARVFDEISTYNKQDLEKMRRTAGEDAKRFNWNKIIDDLEEIMRSPINCVVIGGAGFIGSHLVEELLKKGKKVTVIDNLSTGKKENIPDKVKFIKADIKKNITNLELGRIDCVFDLAAQVSVKKSFDNPLEDMENNIIGTLNVFNFCVKNNVKKIIFSSSAAVYDADAKLPLTEDSIINPKSPYGLAKRTSEKYLEILAKERNIDYVALRYANVYGPRQNPKGEAGVISIFIENMLKDEQININGDGKQTRDFVFVKDVALANIAAMNLTGTYNVSSEKEISINQLVEILKKKTEYHGKIKHSPELQEIKRSLLSSKRLSKKGWQQKVDLERGLDMTVEWFKNK